MTMWLNIVKFNEFIIKNGDKLKCPLKLDDLKNYLYNVNLISIKIYCKTIKNML